MTKVERIIRAQLLECFREKKFAEANLKLLEKETETLENLLEKHLEGGTAGEIQ